MLDDKYIEMNKLQLISKSQNHLELFKGNVNLKNNK